MGFFKNKTLKNGEEITFHYENPSKRSEQFAEDLRNGANSRGEVLRDTQKAYRSGYLSARRDSAECYKMSEEAKAEISKNKKAKAEKK